MRSAPDRRSSASRRPFAVPPSSSSANRGSIGCPSTMTPPAWRTSSTACTNPAAAIRACRTLPLLSDSAAPIVHSLSTVIRPPSLRATVPYTARVLDEPVRGGFPDPQFFSLPGIDQLRAFLRNMVLPTPISHLVGLRLTQVGSGTTVVSMPLSPWLQLGDGTV